jgi:2'-hydroxyisoflavone reductase
MKLLILGGTLYLGRHTVEAALARGHEVTLFNRGRTNPDLFPEVERLRGDREGDLSALRGRRWDVVIDPSGYLPRSVRASCELLRDAVSHYTFISSINVYADATKAGIVETDPLVELPAGAPEEVNGETYGPYKALCEREVESAFAGRFAVVRAGLIYGPHDVTERSGYWPLRAARGGEVLAPGRPERPIQLVDVRDLAAWLVEIAERRIVGAFNGTGPKGTLTMEGYLDACRRLSSALCRLVWMDEEFLLDQKVGPYSELPLWVPEKYQAFETANCSRAFAAGLRCRPLVDTIRDTLSWTRSLPPGPRLAKLFGVIIPSALSRERERELLAAWHARAGAGA